MERPPHLLFAAVRSAFARKPDRRMIGFRTEAMIGALEPAEARAFALATRDPLAERPGFVPPFFVARLIFPLVQRVMTHPALRLNLLRMVHGQMAIEWHRPVPLRVPLRVRLEVTAIDETPAGDLVSIAGSLFDGAVLLCEALLGLMVRLPRRGAVSKRAEVPPPDERFRVALATDRHQPREYAKASLDSNPIHTSRLFARLAGLPGPIMHGMCVLAMVHRALAEAALEGERDRIAAISARFKTPVLPGQSLTVVAYKSASPAEIPFAVMNPDGLPVLQNGLVRSAPR